MFRTSDKAELDILAIALALYAENQGEIEDELDSQGRRELQTACLLLKRVEQVKGT